MSRHDKSRPARHARTRDAAAPAATASMSRARPWGRWTAAGVVTLAVGAMLAIWPAVAPSVLLLTLLDLLTVAVLLVAATALGAAILWALGLAPDGRATSDGTMPRPLAILAAAALGVGAISLTLLILGGAGWLARPVLFGLPAAAMLVGALPLWRLWRNSPRLPADPTFSNRWSLAGLVLVPAVLVVLAGVNLPPGILWAGNVPAAGPHQDLEGYGYDALEYHLQVPREYLDRGRVRFLPHNVYSAFPQNAEMWFMLLMGLWSRPQAAVYVIQMFNLVLAGLAVAAVYVAGRVGRGGGGPLAAAAVAAVPMLAAVAVVAYVEPMMMFFMAIALAMLRQYQLSSGDTILNSPSSGQGANWHEERIKYGVPGTQERIKYGVPGTLPDERSASYAIIVGLLCGLAAGTKYLAIPLFILPLAAGLLLTRGLVRRLDAAGKLRHAMLAATGVLVAFAPWLIRNAAQAGGNPFFPLLWNVLGGGDWTAAEAMRWQQAHLPAVPLGQRLAHAWWRFGSHPSLTLLGGTPPQHATTASSLYGPWLWLLCWPVFLTRNRSRWDWLLLATAAGQFAFWIGVSHVPGRFILPAVLPLGLLVGRSMAAVRPVARGGLLVVLLSFALVSSLQLHDRLMTDAGRRFLAAGPDQSADETTGRPIEPAEVTGRLFRSARELFEGLGGGESADLTPTAFLNRRLESQGASPTGRPILWLVGESRPFYIRYPVAYNVVFSRDLLAEALAEADSPDTVRAWLLGRGLRYIYVDWMEVERLRRTYGFPAVVQRATLDRLGSVTPAADKARSPWWLIDLSESP